MRIIAITQRVEVLPEINERRDCLAQDWIQLARTCGFAPLLLPNDQACVKDILESIPVSGFILTGGNTLVSLGGDAPERDSLEHMLIDQAISTQTPLLGVCRGMQILLEHFGARIHKVEGHVKTRHTLDNGVSVNSYHNFAAHCCAPPLQPLLWSNEKDGNKVIEAVQHSDCPWIRGVMWHPERENPMQQSDIALIKELFDL